MQLFNLAKGPSIKDVRSKLGLFDPSPPCPSYDVTVTTQVSLICPLWADPPPTVNVLCGCPQRQRYESTKGIFAINKTKKFIS